MSRSTTRPTKINRTDMPICVRLAVAASPLDAHAVVVVVLATIAVDLAMQTA